VDKNPNRHALNCNIESTRICKPGKNGISSLYIDLFTNVERHISKLGGCLLSKVR
jgi:hypothetical protein